MRDNDGIAPLWVGLDHVTAHDLTQMLKLGFNPSKAVIRLIRIRENREIYDNYKKFLEENKQDRALRHWQNKAY